MKFKEYPGWFGVFTRERVKGAYPNGAQVKKIDGERGDFHPVGAKATVIGSVVHPQLGLAYFVEWDDMPREAIAVMADKLARLEEPLVTITPLHK